MNAKLILRASLFTLLFPGSVVGLFPFLIIHGASASGSIEFSVVTVIAVIAAMAGLAVLLHSIWGFAFHGHGTLAPVDPPRVLVVRGFYRFTRNPMYVGVLLVLFSEVLLFRSLSLIIYAGLVFVAFHLFVTAYEEPHLQTRFGQSYIDYCLAVPRWRIMLHAYSNLTTHHPEGA